MDNLEALNKVFNPSEQQPSSNETKKGEKFDIYKVDYAWVDKQTNKKEMRLAYEAMLADGGFPDLTQYCLKRLKQLDPKFKTSDDFNKYTHADQVKADADVNDFLRQME